MTRRKSNSTRRILIMIGAVVAVISVVGYLVLLNRKIEPQIILTQSLPSSMVLGERYPVELEATLPWHHQQDQRVITVAGDFMAVGEEWACKHLGPGHSVWRVTMDVISLETGAGKRGILEARYRDYQNRVELGPSTVAGLLKPNETFTPPLSDYQPTATGRPYALWGAIIFGTLAVIGFIVSVLIPGKQPEPVTPGQDLARDIDELKQAGGIDPQDIHQQLSDKVRKYIVQAWNVPVETMMTHAVTQDPVCRQTMPPEVQTAVADYLKQTEQMKYTPDPGADSITRHLDLAQQLLDVSEHHLGESTDDV